MMRSALVLVGLVGLVGSTAFADSFSGFSGVDRPYLVNQDRVCHPLAIAKGAAMGAPNCEHATADIVAHLSIKAPIVQSGAKASFAATASGRTLTVTRKSGDPLVSWEAPDPIGKIVEVYGSQYDDRVAVAYTTRRIGKEVTDIVAFDLGQNQTAVDPHAPTTPVVTPTPVATDPPDVAKAIDAAKKAPKGKQLAAWQAVLALAAGHGEALYRIATLEVSAKQHADAIAALEKLAASTRPDAIEWLVEARFDPAFAPLRAEPKYRIAVGLDRKAATMYERLMGFGGQWEQTGTSCDKPEVRLAISRDRAFKLRVKTTCEGRTYDTAFKGIWAVDGTGIVLTVPTKGQKVTDKDQMGCRFEGKGDEDAMHCTIGHDLEFTVLPTRR